MSVSSRWFRWNAAAWVTGFILYTPIAHGLTGAHPEGLTAAQVAAHSLAVAVVGVIVAAAQRRALSPDVAVSWVRVPIAAVAFNIGYWTGSEQPYLPGWDMDIILGFLALGSAAWLGCVPSKGHRVAAAIALLSFPVASIVIELGLVIAVSLSEITPDLQASTFQHSIFWITVGGGSGVLGGWVSGLALARMVPAPAR
jgi:hypothetical protein